MSLVTVIYNEESICKGPTPFAEVATTNGDSTVAVEPPLIEPSCTWVTDVVPSFSDTAHAAAPPVAFLSCNAITLYIWNPDGIKIAVSVCPSGIEVSIIELLPGQSNPLFCVWS